MVWTQETGYNETYNCDGINGKGRVGDWLKQQPSIVSDNDLSWSSVSTAAYMEMLKLVSRPAFD